MYGTQSFLGCRTFVYEVYDIHIRNTRIRLQSYLAGTTIRIAYLDMVLLNLWAQLTQPIPVEFREGEASVASKAATPNALRQIDIV